MKKIIAIWIMMICLSSEVCSQTFIKMLGKKGDYTITTYDGQTIRAGTKIEMNVGSTANGIYKHFISSVGMNALPLGGDADYEICIVDHIRYSKKEDRYYVFVNMFNRLWLADIDKALKSGEIKRIINDFPEH